jgi:hypothetical protein
MKITTLLITVALAACFMLNGCGKKEGVDTSKLEKSFAAAQTDDKVAVDQAIAAIKEQKYPDALAALQKEVAKPALTADQQSAIKDIIAQIQQQIQQAAQKATDEAKKSLDSLKLPGK